jgi:fumarate reductase subunit C
MTRRPYERAVKWHWWVHRPRYVVYMVRELTSLFVGAYCTLLMIGLIRLAQGEATWERFVGALSGRWGIAFQLLCLAFATFHTVTWFAVTPKALPLTVKGEPVSATAIIGAHYAAWALLSAIVLIAAGA